MGRPLLYEINTRCWLRELSSGAPQTPVTLLNVPEREFRYWNSAGFTHIWLMGVWGTGGKTLRAARSSPGLMRCCSELLPNCLSEDIGSSPYAISGYRVAPELGGEQGLRVFREKLHKHGLKLVLDFIPNHVGLDHPWVEHHPERFVTGSTGQNGCFGAANQSLLKWLAHGRDPHFPPWDDTVQLDYRLKDTREAMIAELLAVAEVCDGVRCDMAMLLLKKVFHATWAGHPRADAEWQEEFWGEAIRTVRASKPGFLFLAEAYWGLEPELCALGFDYAYDKPLYDHLLNRDAAGVCRHLYAKPGAALAQGAFFLENHDERRVASVLTIPEHRAAALLVLSLPGLTLLHEGQLAGAKIHVPVQFLRRPDEPVDPAVASIYDELLPALRQRLVGRGACNLLKPEPLPGNTCAAVVAIRWSAACGTDLVMLNLGDEVSRFSVDPGCDPAWHVSTLLPVPGAGEVSWSNAGVAEVALPAYGFTILSFRVPGT
jgi:hypothetical protein